MNPKYTKIAAVAAGAMLAIGGVAVAANAADPSATPTASSSASTSGGTVTTDGGTVSGGSTDDSTEGHGKGGRGGDMGASQDTPVTGDEAQKVIDAVKASDATITVESVRKDPDGSYDAIGTKDGQPVMVNVSADLATIEVGQGGGKGGGGAMGGAGQSHTEVTGDEATKVTAAVTAKDSGYSVTSVQKDDDGSYDVHATKADGTTVMLEVSADLTTIEERVRGDR